MNTDARSARILYKSTKTAHLITNPTPLKLSLPKLLRSEPSSQRSQNLLNPPPARVVLVFHVPLGVERSVADVIGGHEIAAATLFRAFNPGVASARRCERGGLCLDGQLCSRLGPGDRIEPVVDTSGGRERSGRSDTSRTPVLPTVTLEQVAGLLQNHSRDAGRDERDRGVRVIKPGAVTQRAVGADDTGARSASQSAQPGELLARKASRGVARSDRRLSST